MNKVGQVNRPVDETLAVPLYHQVYLILRENIRSGIYPSGAPLPPEQSLCKEFDVSRITIKRAMRDLVADGLVVRQRGKGTFVADGVTTPARPDALDDLLKTVQVIGESTEVQHLANDVVEPLQDVALKLNIKPGEGVLRTSHLRLSDGEPLAVIMTHVLATVADRLDPTTESEPMLVRLNHAGVAVSPC